MSCEKMGLCLQGQSHSVGIYNQNMTVSFISSKPVSFYLFYYFIIIIILNPLSLSVDHHKQRSHSSGAV